MQGDRRTNRASPLPARASHDASDRFYRLALLRLSAAHAPFMVGGAYALESLTGIRHRTKDLDLFVRQSDCDSVLRVLRELGCTTEMTHPHWLAKAYWQQHYIDVIFSSGNGQALIDDRWFEHALPGNVLGVLVRVCPVEETIWTKSFVMERERYDGADVAHLLRAYADRLDWQRVLDCFGSDWPVLLSHLSLFGFIYPGDRKRIPAWLVRELMTRAIAQWETPAEEPQLCRGVLLSRTQYRVDILEWQYLDARVQPFGRMTIAQAARWSDAAPDGAGVHASPVDEG